MYLMNFCLSVFSFSKDLVFSEKKMSTTTPRFVFSKFKTPLLAWVIIVLFSLVVEKIPTPCYGHQLTRRKRTQRKLLGKGAKVAPLKQAFPQKLPPIQNPAYSRGRHKLPPIKKSDFIKGNKLISLDFSYNNQNHNDIVHKLKNGWCGDIHGFAGSKNDIYCRRSAFSQKHCDGRYADATMKVRCKWNEPYKFYSNYVDYFYGERVGPTSNGTAISADEVREAERKRRKPMGEMERKHLDEAKKQRDRLSRPLGELGSIASRGVVQNGGSTGTKQNNKDKSLGKLFAGLPDEGSDGWKNGIDHSLDMGKPSCANCCCRPRIGDVSTVGAGLCCFIGFFSIVILLLIFEVIPTRDDRG